MSIPVVLLGEIHGDSTTIIRNYFEVEKLLRIPGDKLMHPSQYLMVSEGRELNTAFNSFHPPKESVLLEYGEQQSKSELLIKLLVTVNLLISILNGKYKPGTKCAHVPESVTIIPEFFMERAMHTDGFMDIFAYIKYGYPMYVELIRFAFTKNKIEFIKTYREIFRQLQQSRFLHNIHNRDEIEHYMTMFNRTPKLHFLLDLLDVLQNVRDEEIIEKIEHIAERHKLKLIIIIFGKSHYDNLEELIQTSDVLTLHPASSI